MSNDDRPIPVAIRLAVQLGTSEGAQVDTELCELISTINFAKMREIATDLLNVAVDGIALQRACADWRVAAPGSVTLAGVRFWRSFGTFTPGNIVTDLLEEVTA